MTNGQKRTTEAGRGFIGFLVALVVVGVAGYALLQYYQIKVRADDLDEFTYQTVQLADLNKMKEDDLRMAILKKAHELGVPLSQAQQIEVANDSSGWRIRFSWDEDLVLPGYRRRLHYAVDRSWKRF